MVWEEPILRGGTSRTRVVLCGFENITQAEALRMIEGSESGASRKMVDLGNFALHFPGRREEIRKALVSYRERHKNAKNSKLANKILCHIAAVGMLEAMCQ